MFLLIYGEDTYRSQLKLAAMRERFSAARDPGGLNVRKFCAPDAKCDDVINELFSSPFLSEKKLVIIRGFLRSAISEQDSIKDALLRKPDSTVAIFYEDAGGDAFKGSPLFPVLSAERFSTECRPLTNAEQIIFVRDALAARGMTMSPGAVRFLLQAVGTDTWRLHQELEKSIALAASRHMTMIDEKAVHLLVVDDHEESIFSFVDACIAGRGGQSLMLLESLFAAGVSEVQIIATLLRQFRLLVAAADLQARGARDIEGRLKTALGTHPFAAKKAAVSAKKNSSDVLYDRYRRLLSIERAAKTGSGRVKTLLGLFAIAK